MSRGFLLVLDSLGVGPARDAEAFGDSEANTLGHVAESVALDCPELDALGLGAASHAACGTWPRGLHRREGFQARHGCADEQSHGKDTPSGHWEMAGLPVTFEWGAFPPGPPSFPQEMLDALIARTGVPGLLGNKAMSGTTILQELGEEHIVTGKPIVYTSADSVFQVAAHEEAFGLERLYRVCEIARELVDAHRVGRVIARPFRGTPGAFERTYDRRDYTLAPHGPTLLDHLVEAGREVLALGKIADIFAGRGITRHEKAGDNDAVFNAVEAALASAPEGSLTFANFVDFDSRYGHRRDPEGYARALEAFDRRLPRLRAGLRAGDLVILTADHGNDPTWRGTDHTRERVPILAFGPGVEPGALGCRQTFADMGQSLADHLGVGPLTHGTSFL